MGSATRVWIGVIPVAVSAVAVSGCSSASDSGDAAEATTPAASKSAATEDSAGSSPAPSSVTTAPTLTTVTTVTTVTTPLETAPDSTSTSATATSEPRNVDEAPPPPDPVAFDEYEVVVFDVPAGSRPHDVAPAADGGVWYTAQRQGALGYLDPETGATRHIPLGDGAAPHGVIVDDDGLAWVTDGGLNAIVSVDPATDEVTVFPLPADAPNANLNTAAFDGDGRLWFTGQGGVYGVLDPATGVVDAFASPRGSGPYGITATPDGDIYFASLAGSYIGLVIADGSVIEIDPPTSNQGARRVWSDSSGAIWVSEWNSGQLSRFTPGTGSDGTGEWGVWPLPGDDPSTYAVYVDEADQVWVSDFGGNAIHRFDPTTEHFDTFELPASPSNVRQILGRGNEIWGAQSADDSLIVIRPAR